MHWMAYYDFLRAARPELARELRGDLDAALRRHAFAAVLVDGEGDIAGLLDTYLPQDTVFADDRMFRPVTGFATRPEFWCVPRTDSGPISTGSQPGQQP
jgi:hypothetical protein